jgi:hypothetical protein
VIGGPGEDMAAGRRRKAPGSRIAEINYLDHVQIAAAVPMVSPREIGGVAQVIAVCIAGNGAQEHG